MTPEQFCYWLQGYYELTNDTDRLSQRDHIIRDHLKTVFDKQTPERIIYHTQPPFTNTPSDPLGQKYQVIC